MMIEQLRPEDLTPEVLNSLLEDVEHLFEQRRLKLENPQVLDLIRALAPFPKAKRNFVLDRVRRERAGRGMDLPEKFDESIQSAFNQHNKDSAVWKKTSVAEKALFFCPGGSGSGYWALDRQRAREWLIARKNSHSA